MNEKVYIGYYHKSGITKPYIWYKMLTKKQLKLLKPFMANIFKEYSYKEIAELAKEKSNNALQTSIKQFIKEKLVNERKVGFTNLYKINQDNDSVYDYLTLLKYDGLPKEVVYSIEAFKKEIEKYTFFFSLVIFGSYVVGKETKKSDLDIVVFIPDNTMESNIKVASNMVSFKSLLPLHVQIITNEDFFEMLINKQANVGKEIAIKHRAIYNINTFYKIIKKATTHGFQY